MASQARIDINTDNAAFEENPGELARILRKLADAVEDGYDNAEYLLKDINGNTVGNFDHFTED